MAVPFYLQDILLNPPQGDDGRAVPFYQILNALGGNSDEKAGVRPTMEQTARDLIAADAGKAESANPEMTKKQRIFSAIASALTAAGAGLNDNVQAIDFVEQARMLRDRRIAREQELLASNRATVQRGIEQDRASADYQSERDAQRAFDEEKGRLDRESREKIAGMERPSKGKDFSESISAVTLDILEGLEQGQFSSQAEVLDRARSLALAVLGPGEALEQTLARIRMLPEFQNLQEVTPDETGGGNFLGGLLEGIFGSREQFEAGEGPNLGGFGGLGSIPSKKRK